MPKVSRKQAPQVSVVDFFRDDRAGLVKSLEENDPDFVYSFRDEKVTPQRLALLKQEVVKDESGNIIKPNSDIVVKTPRAVFEGSRALESEKSFQMARRIASDPNAIRQVAQPRKVPSKQRVEIETGE